MNDLRRQLRLLFFATGATLLAGITLALLVIGSQFVTSPPVKTQLAAWTDGLFPGFQPPPHLVNTARTVEPAPFIPVTGGELPVQAGARPITGPTHPTATDSTSVEWPTGHPMENPDASVVAPTGRLVIPSLGVDQWLEHVPVADGDWDVSRLTEQVGWLETTGAKPHDRYAMVFVGHVTLPLPNGPGPFLRLRDLQPGDEIRYRTAEEEFIYAVDEREIVPPDSVDLLYLEDGKKIVLVTCSDWNYLSQQYDQRLLVQASLVRTVHFSAPVE